MIPPKRSKLTETMIGLALVFYATMLAGTFCAAIILLARLLYRLATS